MDRSQNYRRFGYKFYICIYTITGILLLSLVGSSKSKAQQAPSNTNIAGPSASATGSVTNQAVQVLQGPFAVNTYGNGTSCQGPSLNLSTFGYGNISGSNDPETFTNQSGNYGLSAGFSIPLDKSLQNLCKDRVKVEIQRQQAEADKARLDFELVRSLKCLEIIKSGGFFHPESPYGKICADIVGPSPNGYLMTGNGKVVSKIIK